MNEFPVSPATAWTFANAAWPVALPSGSTRLDELVASDPFEVIDARVPEAFPAPETVATGDSDIVLAPPHELGLLAVPKARARVFESLRLSQSRILDCLAGDGHAVIAVCSAVAGEGKTTVALALAEMLADAFPRQLLLIDAHLRKPQLHRLLDVSPKPGMIDCLASGYVVRDAIRWSGSHWVMPAGDGEALPGTLTWEGERGLLRTLRELFHVVIVDMPPALSYAQEASLLSRWSDGVIWVTQAGSTPADAVTESLELVGRDKLLGVVLNRRRSSLPRWLERFL